MSNASEIEQSDFIGYLNSRTDAHTLAGAHLAEMANMIADFRSGEHDRQEPVRRGHPRHRARP